MTALRVLHHSVLAPFPFPVPAWVRCCSKGCMSSALQLSHVHAGESGVDQLVEIIKVLGTPTKEEIHAMNPNYTEFKFPQIKPHPWTKVFSKRMPPDAIDLVSLGLKTVLLWLWAHWR
jgi:hypothetical protein